MSEKAVQGRSARDPEWREEWLPLARIIRDGDLQVRARLTEQMAERVERVLRGGALDDRIHVDLEGLRTEQVQRGRALEAAMESAAATDCSAVRRSFALLDTGDT